MTKEMVVLSDGTVLRRGVDDSINTEDLPDLSSSSTRSASSTGTIWGCSRGMRGGKVLEHSWIESQWKAPKSVLDSGATDSCAPHEMCPELGSRESEGSR